MGRVFISLQSKTSSSLVLAFHYYFIELNIKVKIKTIMLISLTPIKSTDYKQLYRGQPLIHMSF